MKRISFFLLVCLFSSSLFAQTGEQKQTSEYKNVVGVSPGSLWHGLRLKYERVLTPKLTAGSILTYYLWYISGCTDCPCWQVLFQRECSSRFLWTGKNCCRFS
jgi:hypothetical protein